MYPNDSSFRKYRPKVCADIRGGSTVRGSLMTLTVGLSMTIICGYLGGYFFGNIGDKASNITRRYATPCWPEIDCKMNDLE